MLVNVHGGGGELSRCAFPSFFGMMVAASNRRERAGVAELADAPDLGSGTERCEGSSPFARTMKRTRPGSCKASWLFYVLLPGSGRASVVIRAGSPALELSESESGEVRSCALGDEPPEKEARDGAGGGEQR